jgi:hypothetical protein
LDSRGWKPGWRRSIIWNKQLSFTGRKEIRSHENFKKPFFVDPDRTTMWSPRHEQNFRDLYTWWVKLLKGLLRRKWVVNSPGSLDVVDCQSLMAAVNTDHKNIECDLGMKRSSELGPDFRVPMYRPSLAHGWCTSWFCKHTF